MYTNCTQVWYTVLTLVSFTYSGQVRYLSENTNEMAPRPIQFAATLLNLSKYVADVGIVYKVCC